MTENIRQFIDQVASGENSEAKNALENALSTKAFEALDSYKKELSSGIFGGNSEEAAQVETQEA
jgi:hypothetical protein